MGNIRRVSTAAAAVVATLLAMAGLAFACTESAHLAPISPESGPAGSVVSVSGRDFESTEVEIRWDARDGVVLAVVEHGPTFMNVPVRIPADARTGVHYVVAISRRDHIVVGQSTQPFTVTAAASPAGGTPAPGAETGTGGAAGALGEAAPAPTTSSGRTASPAGSTPGMPTPATEGELEPVTSPVVPGTVDLPAASTSGPEAAAVVDRRSAAGATRPQAEAPSAAAEAATAAEPDQVAVPARSAASDPWSGFAAGAELRQRARTTTPAAEADRSPVLGVVFVLVGLLVLAGSSVGVFVRRRQALRA